MIAVIIPCYRVSTHVVDLIAAIPKSVDRIFCIDDACPESSGKLIQAEVFDPRVVVIFHDENKGVGGAVKTGYRAAVAERWIAVATMQSNELD